MVNKDDLFTYLSYMIYEDNKLLKRQKANFNVNYIPLKTEQWV